MLQSMSNKQHAVISGVCICKASKQISFSSTTLVKFGNLSLEEIEYYIETYMPFDIPSMHVDIGFDFYVVNQAKNVILSNSSYVSQERFLK